MRGHPRGDARRRTCSAATSRSRSPDGRSSSPTSSQASRSDPATGAGPGSQGWSPGILRMTNTVRLCSNGRMHRQIAGKLTRPVTKWIILAFWILGVHPSPFAQSSSTSRTTRPVLAPGSARSRRARWQKLDQFQDHNDIPTLVVYDAPERADRGRPGGMTRTRADRPGPGRTDRAPARSDLTASNCLRIPDHHAADGQVAVATVTFNFGKNGWNDLPDTADAIHKIAKIDGVTVHLAGPGGQAADSADAFKGLDGTLILWTALVVIIILLFTYRSPILWILPIISAGIADGLPGSDLLPGQERRPHGQRPESGDPDDPGDRRRHGLRAAADRALSRGAAPARGPARGDGLRAAPGHAGDHRQCRHGRGRHALPELRGDELHCRARPGPARSAWRSACWR